MIVMARRLKIRALWVACLLTVTLVSIGCSEDKTPFKPTTSYPGVVKYMADSGFRGSAFVSRGTEVLLDQGYGLADTENGIPNSGALKYRIGSMTKSFTAVAVVRLKAMGLITGYDDPLATYFPDYPRADEITIRHLLTHQSGLPDYLNFVDPNVFYTPEELIETIWDEPLDFDPGTHVKYSNTNFLALGILIEELTEQPWMGFLEGAVLNPLDLTSTEFGADPITDDNYAKGYSYGQIADPINMSVAYAAGALVSNVPDMEKWARSFLEGTLLSPDDIADIFPPTPAESNTSTIGMGWFVLNSGGQRVYYHGGDINGFTSLVAMFPEKNGILILLGNEENQESLRHRIFNTIIENEFR